MDADDQIYVCDTFNYRIQKFDSKGHFLKLWEHSFYGPKGIMGDGHNSLYVVDTGNHKVQVFDKDGNFIKEWGGFGPEDGKFKEPIGGVVDPQGFIYVADTDNLRVQKFDPNGKFVEAPLKIPTWRGKNFETPYLAFSKWLALGDQYQRKLRHEVYPRGQIRGDLQSERNRIFRSFGRGGERGWESLCHGAQYGQN